MIQATPTNLYGLADFIALDLETTGLDRHKDKILEVACLRFRDGVPAERFHALVHPDGPVRPFILKLTHIPAEELAAAPAWDAVAPDLRAFLGELPLVAHNTAFDIPFLERSLEAVGQPKLTNPALDSLLAARIAWPEMPNHRLDTLADKLAIETADAHRAMPDAERAGLLLLRALELFAAYPAEVRGAMAHLARGSSWSLLFPEAEACAQLPALRPSTSAPTEPASGTESVSETLTASAAALLTEIAQGVAQGRLLLLEHEGPLPLEPLVRELSRGAPERAALLCPLPLVRALHRALPHATTRMVGRQNLLCLRRFAELFARAHEVLPLEERLHLLTLVPWIPGHAHDDIRDHNGFNPRRNFQLWQKLRATPSTCGIACQGHGCAASAIPAQVKSRGVLLADPSVLQHEFELEFPLLRGRADLIVTGAEQFPAEAERQLSRQVWFYRMRNLVQLFDNPWHDEIGLLPALQAAAIASVGPEQGALADGGLRAALHDCESQLHKLLSRIGRHCQKQKVATDNWLFRESLLGTLEGDKLLNALRSAAGMAEALAKNLPDSWKSWSPDLEGLARELGDMEQDVRFLLEARHEEWIYWVQEWGNPHRARIVARPRKIAPLLHERLYLWTRSVTWIGSPLSQRGNLDQAAHDLGLRKSPRLKLRSFPETVPLVSSPPRSARAAPRPPSSLPEQRPPQLELQPPRFAPQMSPAPSPPPRNTPSCSAASAPRDRASWCSCPTNTPCANCTATCRRAGMATCCSPKGWTAPPTTWPASSSANRAPCCSPASHRAIALPTSWWWPASPSPPPATPSSRTPPSAAKPRAGTPSWRSSSPMPSRPCTAGPSASRRYPSWSWTTGLATAATPTPCRRPGGMDRRRGFPEGCDNPSRGSAVSLRLLHTARLTGLLGLLALAALLAGCYSFSQTSLPSHLRTVVIYPAENKTYQSQMGDKLTTAIRDLLKREAPSLRQVNENGQSEILLTLKSYTNRPRKYSAGGQVEEYEVALVVDVLFRDLVKEKDVYKGEGLRGAGVYSLLKNESEEQHGQKRALEEIQNLIVNNALSGW